MITVTFNPSCQIWQAASDDPKELRPSLCHVQVHPAGYLIATNTNIAAIVPCEIEGAPEDWPGALVPADFLKEVLKNTKQWRATFTIDEKQVMAARKNGGSIIDTVGEGMVSPRIDVILKSTARDKGGKSVQGAMFNPWLMARLALALGVEKNKCVCHEWMGAEKPVLVYGEEPGALGILSPGAERYGREAAEAGTQTLAEIIANLGGETKKAKAAA